MILAETITGDTGISLALLFVILVAVIAGIAANVWQLSSIRTALDLHVLNDERVHTGIESRFQRHSNTFDELRKEIAK